MHDTNQIGPAIAPAVATSDVATGRIEGFDLLRGLCALAVASYHLLSWTGVAHLESWGRYGVYIFFVLSGASMYAAYADKLEQGFPAARFIALRIIRLAPLYVAALLIKTAYGIAIGRSLVDELGMMVLNVSFMFGLGNPGDTAKVIGGWSLGIEFLFYLIFPLLVSLIRSSVWVLIIAGSFLVQHIFVNTVLAGLTLEKAWVDYTQMLSFVFYFCAGCGIGRLILEKRIWRSYWSAILAAGLLLPFCALNGESNLVGVQGLTLSLCAVAIVWCAAGIPHWGIVRQLADPLGRMSYGVYLIHPFAYMAAKPTALLRDYPVAGGALVLIASAVLALLAEKHLEAPLRRIATRRLGKWPANSKA